METKVCKKCERSFQIESEDFDFYSKIKVPSPTLCVECRQQKRYIWRNERTLYRRECSKSKKSIVSIYSPESPFKVYDIHEWWSDSWDASQYGREFNFSRSFFEQFRELQLDVPRLALLSKNCTNSDYTNHASNSKDCYLSYTVFDSENVTHSSNVLPLKNSSDCYMVLGKSNENLYEVVDASGCYNCQYCLLVQDSFDCYYSFDLKGCSNCFLSYNLRGQSYYFMNEKCTKEEYEEKVKQFNLSSYKDRQKLYKLYEEIIFEKAYHRGMVIDNSINCTGSMISNSKNAKNCYDAKEVEDSKNIFMTTHKLRDSWDSYHIGINSELIYECHALVRCSNVHFTHLSYDNTNLTYCDSCHNSNELFGCVGIKKGAYMILNKQYTKEEYYDLKEQIIEHMRTIGEYGEFFPPELSPFAYNETQAQVYMPLTKEEAIQQGFTWKDNLPGTFGKGSIDEKDIPDSVHHTPETILSEIFTCTRSNKNFNITKQELDLLKKLNVPIPRLHHDERYKDRLLLRPSRTLYKTKCVITGEDLFTPYPPERQPKLIISDEVYKERVL